MRHILLAADVTPYSATEQAGHVLSQHVIRGHQACDITIRYYDVENHRVAVVEFKARSDGAVDLFNVTYMPPTRDDLVYAGQVLEGKVHVVNTEGSAHEPQ